MGSAGLQYKPFRIVIQIDLNLLFLTRGLPKRASVCNVKNFSFPRLLYSTRLRKYGLETALNLICRSIEKQLICKNARTLYHSLFYRIPHSSRVPVVVTAHDMIAEEVENDYLQDQIPLKRIAFERANRIVCISQTTAAAVTKFYPRLESKVEVATLGGDHILLSPSVLPKGLEIPSPYALFVGQRKGYKNFVNIMRAMSSVQWPRELMLVVAGGSQLSTEETAIGTQIRHVSFDNDSALRYLYEKAVFTLVPSLQEGFGLPVIESHYCGTPTACSDIAIFHEVAGQGSLFFDPYQPDSIAAVATQLMDLETHHAIKKKALENAGNFSWSHTATLYSQVYESLV